MCCILSSTKDGSHLFFYANELFYLALRLLNFQNNHTFAINIIFRQIRQVVPLFFHVSRRMFWKPLLFLIWSLCINECHMSCWDHYELTKHALMINSDVFFLTHLHWRWYVWISSECIYFFQSPNALVVWRFLQEVTRGSLLMYRVGH